MKKFHWTAFLLLLISISLVSAPTLNSVLQGMQAEETAEAASADTASIEETSSVSEDENIDVTIVGRNGQEHKDLSAYECVGTIYIGDSRTVGMDDVIDIENEEENAFVVAKVGQGYSWFSSTALTQVEQIKKRNTDIDAWQYIINLGVNDLGSIDKYLEKYEKLAEEDNIEIILVSVNPVKNYPTVSNDDIEAFNEKLEESGFYYIDTYSVLEEEGFSTSDGLHYTSDTYELIYETINDLR